MRNLVLLLCIVFQVTRITAAELKMGTSDGAPYAFIGSDRGIEPEIVKAALPDHRLRFSFMSYARAYREISNKRLDIVAPAAKTPDDTLFYSDVHVYYHPIAFSLKSRQLNLTDITQLRHYSIATFQGAAGYFGEAFRQATRQSPHYHELPNTPKLVNMLKMGRVDIVVFNFSIFNHYWQAEGYNSDILTANQIFALSPAYTAFHDPALRDRYNRGLQRIINNGRYRQIIERYLPPATVERIMALHRLSGQSRSVSVKVTAGSAREPGDGDE